MSSNNIKNELADHMYQYLCHEAQYSDLPEAARESLVAASECIEQAYKLNTNNGSKQADSSGSSRPTPGSSSILPDELLRIFTRHKEFLLQQKDSLKYPLRTENESSSVEKSDIKSASHPLAPSDPHNPSNFSTASNNNPHSTNINNANQIGASNALSQSQSQQQQQLSQQQQHQPQPVPATTTKQHTQHTISQLPMTTRKKLTQLRAQIKRQASKAARSRLEKRSSVSGVGASSSSSGGAGRHLGNLMGTSFDTANSSSSKQAGDGCPSNVGHNLTSNPSSSVDSPNAYSTSQSTSSPANRGGNSSGAQIDSSMNSSLSPNQHNESSASSSGAKNHQGSSGHHNHHSFGVSVHQKNFKQKLIALIKKFRTDGSDFDSEEQYREALERELMKAAAGRGSRAIEELLEEDIDVEEESGSEPEDWDNISETSTPKPSLRPFFSSTTLDKI